MVCVAFWSIVLGEQPDQVFYFSAVRFCFVLGSGYLIQGFRSHSPAEILLDKLFFSGAIGLREILSFHWWRNAILCSHFVTCRNRSNHCLGVNTAFLSEAFASSFGTIFFSKNFRFNLFENQLTGPCCILRLSS